MGQLSDGRSCFGTPLPRLVASTTDTCPDTSKDLLRSKFIPQTTYGIDWFRGTSG